MRATGWFGWACAALTVLACIVLTRSIVDAMPGVLSLAEKVALLELSALLLVLLVALAAHTMLFPAGTVQGVPEGAVREPAEWMAARRRTLLLIGVGIVGLLGFATAGVAYVVLTR